MVTYVLTGAETHMASCNTREFFYIRFTANRTIKTWLNLTIIGAQPVKAVLEQKTVENSGYIASEMSLQAKTTFGSIVIQCALHAPRASGPPARVSVSGAL